MSLVRFFRKKQIVEPSRKHKWSSDYLEIRGWHKFINKEEGAACLALTFSDETLLICCNYAGQIHQILQMERQEALSLMARRLGADDFVFTYVSYKQIIKENINVLFNSVGDELKLSPPYAIYNQDVKTLIWNIFTPGCDPDDEQDITWGNLKKYLELRVNIEKFDQHPSERLRVRGLTV